MSDEEDFLGFPLMGKEQELAYTPIDLEDQAAATSEQSVFSPNSEPSESNASSLSNVRLSVGMIIWAKLNPKADLWPAIIVNGNEFGLSLSHNSHTSVFWLGDYRVSIVPLKLVKPFYCFDVVEPFKRSRLLTAAITEAIKIEANRRGFVTMHWNSEEAINWGKTIGKMLPQYKDEGFIPENIMFHMRNLRKKLSQATEEVVEPKSSDSRKVPRDLSRNCCLSCRNKVEPRNCFSHPIFSNGKLCSGCKKHEKKRGVSFISLRRGVKSKPTNKHLTMLILGPSLGNFINKFFCLEKECAKKMFCATCSNASTDLSHIHCASENCFIMCCEDCIVTLCKREEYTTCLKNNKKWYCFFCKKVNKGIFRLNSNWLRELSLLYHRDEFQQVPKESKVIIGKKLRVLSLIKGVGQGVLSVANLSVHLEDHFIYTYGQPLPSNTNGILVPDNVTLKTINNIDLVIGCAGSINSDWSGKTLLGDLNGQGGLVFDFYDIVSKLQEENPQVNWVFESPATIPVIWRDKITRYMECNPDIIDIFECKISKNRYRLCWSNCMSSEYIKETISKGLK